jgi:pyruvate formate lyase activating enzyme
MESRCKRCGECIRVCQMGAISLEEERIRIDRVKCTNCGECKEVCTQGAMKFFGNDLSVDDVVEEVTRDWAFYQNSDGGMTASGGEPLYQPTFLKALLKRCHEKGIHTALDTCGYGKPEVLQEVLEYTDLVLFDLKHMDPTVHKRVTSVTNELILQNAVLLAKGNIPTIFRIPLIRGINDSEDNIRATAEFAAGLKVKQLDLLPYHPMGVSKYSMLDRGYRLDGSQLCETEEVEKLRQMVEGIGMKCEIGG